MYVNSKLSLYSNTAEDSLVTKVPCLLFFFTQKTITYQTSGYCICIREPNLSS